MYCYGHNFVIIGSILEILDVLSSPNRVASNFGILCDNGRLLGDTADGFGIATNPSKSKKYQDRIEKLPFFKSSKLITGASLTLSLGFQDHCDNS